MLYLANISYQVSEYMGKTYDKEAIRLVEAVSEEEAEKKATKHYENKTKEYCVYYFVSGVDISEVIK